VTTSPVDDTAQRELVPVLLPGDLDRSALSELARIAATRVDGHHGAMEATARSEGPSLIELYERVRVEDARLEVDALGALEFVRIQEILRRHLPPPPAVIRDVGGGTGIHARWLAGDGYSLELLDPVPLHIEGASAEAKRGASFGVQLGDARTLPWTAEQRRRLALWPALPPAGVRRPGASSVGGTSSAPTGRHFGGPVQQHLGGPA
jgi:hypothetical protein